MANKTCFVVMGFGTKTDYTKPKTFNLDKTYRTIIKPAAVLAGLDCVRADEIQHSGNINVPMYQWLLNADVVVADVSTYNCNAFYELGVRHALRPHSTIIICEDGLTFPFDIGQIAVRKYHHLGEGIDFEEVQVKQEELSKLMMDIVDQKNVDSPVYTFIPGLNPPGETKVAASLAATPLPPPPPDTRTVSILTEQAEKAMDNKKFLVAKELFQELRELIPQEPHYVQRLALATYKSKMPTEKEALDEARALLETLKPEDSTDPETLGLLQSVHKRLWSMEHDHADLERAIWASEKGFVLRNDYYNGINLAFLYNVRSAESKGAEAIADFVNAQRVRRRVMAICEALLREMATDAGKTRYDPEAGFWVMATLAQAYVGLGDEAKAQEHMNKALELKPPGWMVESTEEQLKILRSLLEKSPLVGL
jgi:hypothetical protein